MRSSIVLGSFLLAFSVMTASSFAADIGTLVNNENQQDKFKIITVNDLAKQMADPNSHVRVFDADGPDTRAKEGMIPGARPLSSDDRYDVADELPSDKHTNLVFYCHNYL